MCALLHAPQTDKPRAFPEWQKFHCRETLSSQRPFLQWQIPLRTFGLVDSLVLESPTNFHEVHFVHLVLQTENGSWTQIPLELDRLHVTRVAQLVCP